MDEMVPRKTIVKHGSKGVGGIVGGAVVLALGGLGAVGSLVVGGVIALVGLGLTRSKDDRTAGIVATTAGVITAATALPFLGGLAGTLLTISGIGLLIAGGLNIFKFIRGYRSRT